MAITTDSSPSWSLAIKALTFDVFGTCVDWRSTVQQKLRDMASEKAQSDSFASVPGDTQKRAMALLPEDWAAFAQAWRDSYKVFTHSFVPGESAWKDIDAHHYESLAGLFDKWQLTGLYSQQELRDLSLVWHSLRPWADSSPGIHKLGTRYVTSTLSNGNRSLLDDLDRYGSLGFRNIISAADFKAYKPSSTVYLGAASDLGVHPSEIAMVAAHLGDLEAARACGMRTIYVERLGEEDWKPDEARYREAKGWVDMWVTAAEDGFLEVARRLGLD